MSVKLKKGSQKPKSSGSVSKSTKAEEEKPAEVEAKEVPVAAGEGGQFIEIGGGKRVKA